MIVYVDTSALIKLIFDEPGSDMAGALWDHADLVASGQLVYPEARAAVAAAHRAGRIDATALDSAMGRLEDLYGELRIIGIDEPLARHAGEVAAEHGLRGYDAVHLAAALAINAADVMLATWDRALSDAACATGRLHTHASS